MYEGQFFESFSIIEDTREQGTGNREQGKGKREKGKGRHKLIDIIFIVVSAIISGCNEWKEIRLWTSVEPNITWLKKYIELPNGMPSLSTIGRLFNIISPKQFEKCFIHWMKSAVNLTDKDIISIDGKTMRGTIEGDMTKKYSVRN